MGYLYRLPCESISIYLKVVEYDALVFYPVGVRAVAMSQNK